MFKRIFEIYKGIYIGLKRKDIVYRAFFDYENSSREEKLVQVELIMDEVRKIAENMNIYKEVVEEGIIYLINKQVMEKLDDIPDGWTGVSDVYRIFLKIYEENKNSKVMRDISEIFRVWYVEHKNYENDQFFRKLLAIKIESFKSKYDVYRILKIALSISVPKIYRNLRPYFNKYEFLVGIKAQEIS